MTTTKHHIFQSVIVKDVTIIANEYQLHLLLQGTLHVLNLLEQIRYIYILYHFVHTEIAQVVEIVPHRRYILLRL